MGSLGAFLTAAKRALLCRLGYHDFFHYDVRPYVHYGIPTGERIMKRACRVAACQRRWHQDKPHVWIKDR